MLGWVKLISKGYSRHLWCVSMPCSTCWLVAGPGKTPCRPGFGNHCRFQWELAVECKADHYWVALVAITAPGDLLGTLSWWGWWHPMQLLGLLFALLSFAAGGLERLKMAANRDRTGVLSHVHQRVAKAMCWCTACADPTAVATGLCYPGSCLLS